jgi:exodeoxyribonuclease VII large subunit
VHLLSSRRGLAGWHARLALRGRHAAELTHELRRAARAQASRQERRFRDLRLRLEARDLRRSLAAIRARLAGADSGLRGAAARTRDRAAARLTGAAARLDTLSPLAVLSRGYAVCWTADRTRIVRSADAVAPGERVRITLHQGELECEVRGQ